MLLIRECHSEAIAKGIECINAVKILRFAQNDAGFENDMNYGKNAIKKREEKLLALSPKMGKKGLVWVFKLVLIAMLFVVVIGVMMLFGIYRGIIDSSPSISDIDATPTGFLSTVLDADGNVTATLVATGSNRVYVTIDEIPESLQYAFVAVEDERFYEHKGIDLKGIVRAGVLALSSGNLSQGASTITQQLLKNNVFENWATETNDLERIVRKLQEQYLALELEKVVDKNWILENYMNTVNLGQNTLGVQAAARRYFGKDVSDLTISESAVIAGITKYPSAYNPISHPDKNSDRRDVVLTKMLEQGYITKGEYDAAKADNVYDRIQVYNQALVEDNTQINSYFVDALINQVIKDLMEIKGYNKTQAYKALYNGGLTILSTQDPYLQNICDDEVNNIENYSSGTKYSFTFALSITDGNGDVKNYDERTMLSYYQNEDPSYSITYATEEDAYDAYETYKSRMMGDDGTLLGEKIFITPQPQAALTVIDQETGEVKAIVGGRGEKTASRTLNRATDTTRQPGSCFKVLAAYAPAIEEGGKSIASTQDDAPYEYSNGTPLHNYDDTYRGYTSYRTAIMKSINIVTVKALKEIGVDLGYEYLEKFGFTTLEETDKVESLALGGITRGVTNLELTAAYAAIANGGEYIKPRFYTKILDHNGNVLIDNTPQKTRVLREGTAWVLTDAMRGTLTSEGTSPKCRFEGMDLAGKSGTTTKDRDMLFAGYSPYYTCVVWGGRDDNTPMPAGSFQKTIWHNVMQRMHEGLEYREFEKPASIVEVEVCAKSGLLAVEGVCDCDPRGSQVYTEYFEEGYEPTEYCDKHIGVVLCSESGELATEHCPEPYTSVYISKAAPGSPEAEYTIPPDIASLITNGTYCNLHGEAPAVTVEDIPEETDEPEEPTEPEPVEQMDWEENLHPEENGEENAQVDWEENEEEESDEFLPGDQYYDDSPDSHENTEENTPVLFEDMEIEE